MRPDLAIMWTQIRTLFCRHCEPIVFMLFWNRKSETLFSTLPKFIYFLPYPYEWISINRLLLTLKSDDLVKTILDGDKKFGNDSKFKILTATIRSSHQRCSMKKGVLRNFTKFTGKHLCQSLFFNKVAGLRPQTCNFIKKEPLAQVFCCEFCENSKNTLFTEHLWTSASELNNSSKKI